MILLFVSVIVEHDGRRPGLSNALVEKEHDNNRDHRDIASHSSKHTAYNITAIQHIHIVTYSPCLHTP